MFYIFVLSAYLGTLNLRSFRQSTGTNKKSGFSPKKFVTPSWQTIHRGKMIFSPGANPKNTAFTYCIQQRQVNN
jgi:hypothetical protein